MARQQQHIERQRSKGVHDNTAQHNRNCESAGHSMHPGARQNPDGASKDSNSSSDEEEPPRPGGRVFARRKTLPCPGSPLLNKSPSRRRGSGLLPGAERIRTAKDLADTAMRDRKIFTIQGPYRPIRESLRSRGWVEKFYKLHMAQPKRHRGRKKKKPEGPTEQSADAEEDVNEQSDDADDDDQHTDDDDDDDDADDAEGSKLPPWEEDNGTYGIMSRMVRNSTPTFIWCVRRDAIDPRTMRDDQVINHYGRATFTTKVGLCLNMRNVPWFEPVDPDTFFPRCYRLSHDEEKRAFIDDYRLTMCMNILKLVVQLCEDQPYITAAHVTSAPTTGISNAAKSGDPPSKSTSEVAPTDSGEQTAAEKGIENSPNASAQGSPSRMHKPVTVVSTKALDLAMEQVKNYVCFRNHDDLDNQQNCSTLTEDEWEELLTWYYQLAHDGATMPEAESRLEETKSVMQRVRTKWPQFDLDGSRNVWIVKPGAKSRGRGITCYDRLEDMLRLVSSVVKKESKFVVQKYIERPLLVHNTKFDIRQWFLVTDWNPLTIWFYKACYLRFCSQEYTLNSFDEAIHLSNNAIQGKKVNGPRSSQLPEENMWTNEDFQDYLAARGAKDVWEEVIYPGMKQAINAALLCTQDVVEYRKSAFELYGADFMLTEDYTPWLIEINSSPSMSPSTKVTAKLCRQVLEDTIKVVVDRKTDRNCDLGLFEMSYRQPCVTIPPYVGMTLVVEGQNVKKPSWARAKSVDEPDKSLVASGSQTSLVGTPPSPYKLSSSKPTEHKALSRLNTLHTKSLATGPPGPHPSTGNPRLATSSGTGLKISTLRTLHSNKESGPAHSDTSAIRVRASSADKAAGRIKSQANKEAGKAAPTNGHISKRSEYLLALRKSDTRCANTISFLAGKSKENPETMKPNLIVNDLPVNVTTRRRHSVTPSSIPLALDSKEDVNVQTSTQVISANKDSTPNVGFHGLTNRDIHLSLPTASTDNRFVPKGVLCSTQSSRNSFILQQIQPKGNGFAQFSSRDSCSSKLGHCPQCGHKTLSRRPTSRSFNASPNTPSRTSGQNKDESNLPQKVRSICGRKTPRADTNQSKGVGKYGMHSGRQEAKTRQSHHVLDTCGLSVAPDKAAIVQNQPKNKSLLKPRLWTKMRASQETKLSKETHKVPIIFGCIDAPIRKRLFPAEFAPQPILKQKHRSERYLVQRLGTRQVAESDLQRRNSAVATGI